MPRFRFRYVVIITLVLLCLLSLVSQHQGDLAIIEGGGGVRIRNWVGPAGAHTARWLLYIFGVAVFPMAAFVIVCCLRPFLPYPVKRRGYTGAMATVLVGVTMLLAMWPENFLAITEHFGIGHRGSPLSALSGGVLGQLLAAPPNPRLGISGGLVTRSIGEIGTLTVALVFLMSGLVYVWLADWQVVASSVVRGWWRSRREARAGELGRAPARREDKDKSEGSRDDLDGVPKPQPPLKSQRPLEVVAGELDFGEAMPSDEVARRRAAAVAPDPEPAPESAAEPPPEPLPEPVFDDPGAGAGTGAGSLPPSAKGLRSASPDAPLVGKSASRQTGANPMVPPSGGPYVLPTVHLLSKVVESRKDSSEFIETAKRRLQDTMESFKVDGQVVGIINGPRVTRFEVSLAPGVKVEKVVSIEKNIAMELEAQSIRTLAPIPGRNAVGVEVPNSSPSAVFFRSMLESTAWRDSNAEIPVILGKDVSGKSIILDLAKAPHLMIAGATGSGKSVCMNTLIMSLLFRFPPEDLRLILVDPKVVEMKMYETLPHLITPVVNDSDKVPLALRWGVNEMEKRYHILAKVKARNLKGFNTRPKTPKVEVDNDGNPIPDKLPYVIIIVDELADVMMTDAKSDVETSIARIAQKGRAAGIHVVIATQRPSTNIITGVIKANLPTRIAFRVGSIVDSRVILDQKGAESLLGQGDMLYLPPGASGLERIQGALVDDSDIQKVVDFSASQVEQRFDDRVISQVDGEDEGGDGGEGDYEDDEPPLDPQDAAIRALVKKYLTPDDGDLMSKALEIVFVDRQVSTSYLQRRLKIGYNRAAELVDELEERGIVGPSKDGGSKRDIMVFDQLEIQ